ncbi:Imm63 family immunity protein [Anaeromicrobium sediminis]|uniref:Immunity protein 63 domain-containing protein n=1 Tax=Anaeromicrobium sediminis TaxID=1478221 RepID=A0A267ML76_9FIRM|nr:Imm63 family immunity protein [Anaeromicrobium sediminis]PAB60339.1 hypothetical protein CCE28_05440 [Anaeromicrobium sediminis]
MNYLSLEQIKAKVFDLAKRINAPVIFMPTFGINKDSAQPEIRVDESRYHYVIIERGQELQHKITKDLNELLYWTFEDITFSMASDFELKNRNAEQDFRRILFDKQLKLLSLINEEFSLKRKKTIEKILGNNPFNDNKNLKK